MPRWLCLLTNSRLISIIVFFLCNLSVRFVGPCFTMRSSSSNFWEISFVVRDVFSARNSFRSVLFCTFFLENLGKCSLFYLCIRHTFPFSIEVPTVSVCAFTLRQLHRASANVLLTSRAV